MKSHAALSVLSAVALVTRLSAAQSVSGRVIDSANARPVPGAVVTMLDSLGGTVGRVISSENGTYRLGLKGSERTARITRIGFRPSVVRLSGTDSTLDVRLVAAPTLLDPVRVDEPELCSRDWRDPKAFGLMEQARASLLNSVVAATSVPVRLVRLSYERNFYRDSIYRMPVRIDSASRAAASYALDLPPSSFATNGFVASRGGDSVFYAPDAQSLLDSSFAGSYCFRTVANDETTSLVGLAFRRAIRRRDKIDIAGTLWIDTTSRQLRRLVFEYTGVPSAPTAPQRPGGFVSFAELPTGMVYIDRWSISVPAPRRNSVPGRPGIEIHETGGEVAEVRLQDGRRFASPLGRLSLFAISPQGKPAEGLMIRLDSTDYQAVADSAGALTIDRLLPGPYRIVVSDTALDRIGLSIPTSGQIIAARDSVTRARVVARTAREYVHDRCIADKIWSGVSLDHPEASWVIGRAVDATGHPVKNARASMMRASGGATATSRATGDDGVFQLCSADFRVGDDVELTLTPPHGRASSIRMTLSADLVVLSMPVRR